MPKYFTLILSFLICNSIYSQSIAEWKTIIRARLCESDTHSCRMKYERYIEACKSVGDYYFLRKQYKSAARYYEKVAEMDMEGHGYISMRQLTPKGLKNYSKVVEQLGIIHINGLSVKKDKLDAFRYFDIQPNPFNAKKIDSFSMLLFGNKIQFTKSSVEKGVDSIVSFSVNPLYVNSAATIKQVVRELNFTGRMLADSTLLCVIDIYPGMHRSSCYDSQLEYYLWINLQSAFEKAYQQCRPNSIEEVDSNPVEMGGVLFRTIRFRLVKWESYVGR